MPNPVITNNSTSGIVVWEPVYEDDILVDAAGATYPAGTVLGRLTAGGNLTAFTPGAADGSEIPIAVLTVETVLAAATPAPCRPLISGRVRRGKLADNAGAALTQAAVDQLRDMSIIALGTQQLAELDNQP